MGRYALTDAELKAIEPHLPNKPRGVPHVDNRRVLNGIFWGPEVRRPLGRSA
jgi:transposase